MGSSTAAGTTWCVALVALAQPVLAATSSDERIERLESQVEALQDQLAKLIEVLEAERVDEAAQPDAVEPEPVSTGSAAAAGSDGVAPLPAPSADRMSLVDTIDEHLRLGGSANVGYYHGRDDSSFDPGGFLVWDTRFFVDVELGEPVQWFGQTLVRNAGLSFEWNLVRLGREYNDVGDLYVDLQGLGDSPWANLQAGRFQIPVGEAYLRYGTGYAEKPFISDAVGGPWYWDEGIKLYGANAGDGFGYVASITNGETGFNDTIDDDNQYSLKLFTRPTDWLYLSVSGLFTGKLGSNSTPAAGALWLGESWARAFGDGSPIPNFIDGEEVLDGPYELNGTWFAGADAIVAPFRDVRLWLAYGYYDINSKGLSLYDRSLHYWISELLLGGALLHPELRNIYLGLRANGLGSYDDNRGYLLDVRQSGTIGYNASSLVDYSVVLGWRMLKLLTLRLEYTHRDLDLVNGVDSEIRGRGKHLDYFAIELGAHY